MLAVIGTAAGLRDPRITRRRMLGRALKITAVAAIPPAAACAAFSAFTNPDELRVHDQIEAHLDLVTGATDDLA